MDEMSLASIPLCEKSKAPAAKTTMSVREMQHLLGLGKTESYWLIHKNFFEVIQINDKMRVVISSFEKWYANQIKYHKVNGPPPGEELRKRSYSVVEAAEILSVDTETIYSHCHSPNHCLILQWQRSSRILQKACNPHIHKQRQLSVFGKLPLFVLRRCSYLSGQFFDLIECKLRVFSNLLMREPIICQ